MDEKKIKAITGLIDALRNLVQTMGSGPFAVCVVAVVAGIIGFSVWRDMRRARHALLIVDHKEKEIQRLAEDNRRYREVYLSRLGVSPQLLSADAEDSKKMREERDRAKDGKKK